MGKLIGIILLIFMGQLGNAQSASSLDISAVESCWLLLEIQGDKSNIEVVHDCLEEAYVLSEQQMNRHYEEIILDIVNYPRTMYFKDQEIPLVDSEQLALLMKAQEAWIIYRQRECDLSVSNADDVDLGNIRTRSQWLSCMTVQNNIRTESFKLYGRNYYPSPTARG